MADLTLTPSSVLPGSNAVIDDSSKAGETIVAGKAVYRSATTKLWMLADSDSATAEVRKAVGIAVNGANAGQPLHVQTGGDITLGAVLTAGATYFLSNTAGGICPDADVGSGEYVCQLGIAKTTSVLAMAIQFPNIAR